MSFTGSPDRAPFVSVVVPVFNGAGLVERAIASLGRQTLTAWEALIVDDASTDGSAAVLEDLAARDPRLRVTRLGANGGVSAARNVALAQARGEWVAYLDHDDEFYPEYLEQVRAHAAGEADVLVFRYDLIEDRPEHPQYGRAYTHDPAQFHDRLFRDHIAVPLGVAHRHRVTEHTGGFDTRRRRDEDSELWRRFAAAGAVFTFRPERSGLYHIRAGSASRGGPPEPMVTARSGPARLPWRPPVPLENGAPSSHVVPIPAPAAFPGAPARVLTSACGTESAGPLTGHEERAVTARSGAPRVLFASYHCFEDRTSGAALCTHDLFDLLTARGWACEVFTGPYLDTDGAPIGESLRARAGAAAVPGRSGPVSFTEHRYTAPGGYPVAVFEPGPPAARRPPTPDEARAFAARLDQVVKRFRPDVILFYGGDPASQVVFPIARAVGAKVVFWLHNYAYPTLDAFRGCDAVVVPSEANRAHYRTIGLDPVVLPGPWNWDRMVCDAVTPKYVTFVNPEPAKGVFWFARIAEVLDRTRPDIPLLVVEGRGTIDWLGRCGLEMGTSGSLRRMRNTPDPRRFHRLSRLVLMPSLWREGLPRVAVEAMANGIPVLGSGRGGLGEVLDAGGFRLEIPDRFTPDTRFTPTPEDVCPWVETIVRLWDDPAAYAEASNKAKRSAEHAWHPDALGSKWAQFLEELARAPQSRSR